MEVELSQQQYYYDYYSDSGCHSYHYHSCSEPAEPQQQQQHHLPKAADPVQAVPMKDGDVPAPYAPRYWTWEQFAPQGTDSLYLVSDANAADLFDIPPLPAGADYFEEEVTACAAPPQQDCSRRPPPPPRSAFTPYAGPPSRISITPPLPSQTPSRNAHARMLEFLRRVDAGMKSDAAASAASVPFMDDYSGGAGSSSGGNSTNRCFRHMMRERQRRERLSQSYADLYAMVCGRSKPDKNSIVQASAAYLAELRAKSEALRKSNQYLKARAATSSPTSTSTAAGSGAAKIRMRVGTPCSSLDSVMGALRCLKGMGVRAWSIHADVSGQELNAAIDVDTNMATAEVEAAVQGALVEMEKKLRSGPGGRPSARFAGGGTTNASGPTLVPDTYPANPSAAGFLLHESAPSHPRARQLLPGSIARWPTSGSHVSFRHPS